MFFAENYVPWIDVPALGRANIADLSEESLTSADYLLETSINFLLTMFTCFGLVGIGALAMLCVLSYW